MADKTYYPTVIEETPFPGQQDTSTSSSDSGNKTTFTPSTIAERSFPESRIAVEVIGQALNTQNRRILAEFGFTQTGAIQIGEYANGVTGDIRISPNGITARDELGETTFSLDATTGNATFKGTIQAGSFVSGEVVVGDNTFVIDGEEKRMVFNDGTTNRIVIGEI